MAPEGIETLSAFPIDLGVSRYVIYLGLRSQARVGDRWYSSVAPLLHQLRSDIERSADIPVATGESNSSLSRAELRMALEELSELADVAGDENVRSRINRLQARLVPPVPDASPMRGTLTRREVDVLTEIARGLSNRACGESLGLVESTVKTYLKAAMCKLQVHNRVQAISTARQLGLID